VYLEVVMMSSMRNPIFCPVCGAKLPEPEWRRVPYTHDEIAEVKCRKCETEIALTDYSLFEQQGTIEIVYR
jgi:ribosomal protein S27E